MFRENSEIISKEMTDFINGTKVDPDFIKPATKCMMTNAMVQYFIKKGADIETIFKGVHVTPDHVANSDNWISYRDLVLLMKNCQDALDDNSIYDWMRAGIEVTEYTQTRKYALITEIVGIKFMYRKASDIIPTLTTYTNIKLNELKNGFCDCLYLSEDKFNRFGLGHAAHWAGGVLAAVPQAKGYPPADVKIVYSQHLFRNLIEILYEKQGFQYDENEAGEIFIDNDLKAKWVELIKDEKKGFYLNEYNEKTDRPNAVLVIDDIVKDGVLYVQAGEVFGAPYGRIQLRWESEKRFYSPFYYLKRWRKSSHLVTELENQISISDKRTMEAETARNSEKMARIRAESAEKKVKEYADNLEKLIEARTQELQKIQAKLIEAEKRSLENRITGGFAHEMRNALAGAQLQFKSALNYKNDGKSSTETLKDAATRLIEKINDNYEKYKIAKDDISKNFIPELKVIANIADELEITHSNVSKDLKRGLSITSQIHDYARMSELKPGDTEVDIIQLLDEYAERYQHDFKKAGVTYTCFALDKAVVKADEIHLNSIFSNLINNSIDALWDHDDTIKEIRVIVESKEKYVKIAIIDNGPGMDKNQITEIFEPFFSTKPSSGTGLGLSVVKRLVQLYMGKIDVDSQIGKGATFTVTLPSEIELE